MLGPHPNQALELSDAEVEICNGCNEATSRVGEDAISWCPNCRCVEGETRMVTEAEYERLNT